MNRNGTPPNRRPVTTAQAPAARPIRRILVVDDDSDIRRLNSVVLQRSGYEVDTAADGAEAWETLNTESYDLLLTDHDMSRLTGVELIKKLRGALNAMPVILVSGKMPTEELSRHPWLQIEAVLCKPYHGGELLATVEEVLQTNEGRRDGTAHSPANEQWQPTIGDGTRR
jgi:two-component system sensor histidine kinase and response regulator WspE